MIGVCFELYSGTMYHVYIFVWTNGADGVFLFVSILFA